MDFLKLVKDRYSCKKFCDKTVDEKKLAAVLEAGRYAPTAKNSQPQRVIVVKSEDGLKKIDALTPCRYGAPIVLAVGYDKNEVYTYPGGKYDSGVEDATIVATHLTLAATAEGINSCWINCFDPDKAKKELGVPENVELVMLLALGYVADGAGALENHFKRKPIDDTVEYM